MKSPYKVMAGNLPLIILGRREIIADCLRFSSTVFITVYVDKLKTNRIYPPIFYWNGGRI